MFNPMHQLKGQQHDVLHGTKCDASGVDTSQAKTRNETRKDGELTDPIHATV
jgi:hypothetical protein